MRSFLNKLKKSILFYTFIFIAAYYIGMEILNHFNLQYLLWVQLAYLVIACVGIIAGTVQIFWIKGRFKPVKKWIKIPVLTIEVFLAFVVLSASFLFADYQTFTEIEGKMMVKETHSVLLSNWINYYDYKGWFVCGKHERIHEAHDDYIGEYLYTIYYDEDGNYVDSKDLD